MKTGPFSIGVIFVCVWWVIWFMLLPWGVRRVDDPEPGHDAGAPANARIGLKFAVATGITVVITGAIVAVIESGVISLSG